MSGGISYGLPPATDGRRAAQGRPPGHARIAGTAVRLDDKTAASVRRGSKAMALAAVASLLLVIVLVGGRALLVERLPDLLARWDRFWRRPVEQQVTGFVALALYGVALVYPLRRRLHLARRSASVRVLHAVLGALSLAALVVHANLRLGCNLNRLLSIAFLAFATLGGLGSFSTGRAGGGGRARRWAAAAHRLLFWPALALIGLHILVVTYF